MTDDMKDSDDNESSFWPEYIQKPRDESDKNETWRAAIFRFVPFQNFLIAIGKLAGQSIIHWLLFSLLFILLVKPDIWDTDQTYLVVAEIVKLTTFTISVFLAVRIFESTEVVNLGLKRNWMAFQDYFAGMTISFFFLATMFFFLLGAGLIVINKFSWEANSFSYVYQNLAITLIIFIFVGWSEEILSRGYHLRIISKGLNRFFGALLSSLIFANLHRNNPGITTNSLIFIFLFGCLASFAFFRTGQLWLAMGLHTGWDYFVVVIFGSSPMNGLNIFHLMELKYYIHPISYYILNLFGLGIMAIMIYYYTRRKKTELIKW